MNSNNQAGRSGRHSKAVAAACLGLVMALVCVVADPSVSFAQGLETRIDRVEKQLRALQRRVFSGEGPETAIVPDPAVAQGGGAAAIEVRIAALETQIRNLTGQLEELRYQMEESNRRLETFMSDAEYRFNTLEGKETKAPARQGGSSEADSNAQTSRAGTQPEAAERETPQSPGTLPAGTPMEQYNRAYALLAEGQYDAAEAAFRAFLEQRPEDELAGNAHYWLAQSYYVRGQNERAAQAFLEGYQAYPTSSKAPDYLLKIGMTLALIGQKDDACAVFDELASRFPDATTTRDRLADERKQAGCR